MARLAAALACEHPRAHPLSLTEAACSDCGFEGMWCSNCRVVHRDDADVWRREIVDRWVLTGRPEL